MTNLSLQPLNRLWLFSEIIPDLVPLMQQDAKAAKRRLEMQADEIKALEVKRAHTKKALSNFIVDCSDVAERDGYVLNLERLSSHSC